MSLKPSRRGLLIGMGATAADAVLPVQANTRDDPMAYRAAAELVEALAKRRVSSRELVDSAIARPASCLPHAEQRKRAAHSALADQRHSVMPGQAAGGSKDFYRAKGGGKGVYGLHRETLAQILYCRWIRTESGE
jgi:hypothetical protein